MGKEFGRKTYMNSGGYNSLMRTWTDKAVNDVRRQKHSEFKKVGGDYAEMENDFVPPGGLTPPIVKPPTPGDPEWPVIPDGGGTGGDCDISGCWCPGQIARPIMKCVGTVGTIKSSSFDGIGEGGSVGSEGGAAIEIPTDVVSGTLRVSIAGSGGYSGNGYMDQCDYCEEVCAISYGTQIMLTGTTQQLSTPVSESCCRSPYFKLESGGGKVTLDGFVTSASEQDTNCSQNMIIGLYCNGHQVNSIQIAVTKSTDRLSNAAQLLKTGVCRWHEYIGVSCHRDFEIYNCVGTVINIGGVQDSGSYCEPCVYNYPEATCEGDACASPTMTDMRTELLKEEGCCPPQLLDEYLG
jgi:hypothetical protein